AATEAAIQKLVAKLAAKCCHLTFCYEAGPTGYGLYRLLKSLGHDCLVVAPSLVPKKAGDRVKTNRRDAVSLAKLLRADELTAVWVPDERHEAMRDLSRARQAVKKDLQGKRQQISSLMLRLGRIYPGKTTWGPAHTKWLMAQKLEHREQRIAFEELLEGSARKATASSVWKTPSARRCPSGRSPRLSRPCRRCGGLISLRLSGCWPRSVICPAFKNRAS